MFASVIVIIVMSMVAPFDQARIPRSTVLDPEDALFKGGHPNWVTLNPNPNHLAKIQ